MRIRLATKSDAKAVLQIIMPVIRDGTTYALHHDMSESAALDYWMGPDKETFVAEEDGGILGTYYLRANQAGGGAHVCNCGYMVGAAAAGRGVARQMCEHSLHHARARGFKAMQFNFVVANNVRAIALWERMGFEIVGRLPGAFVHPQAGYVDALVMYRTV